MNERISVRATETLVANMLKAEEDAETGRKVVNATRQRRRQTSPQVEAMQEELRMVFGTKVEIKCSARGRGKITMHFSDSQEFERLRALLTNESRPKLRVAG